MTSTNKKTQHKDKYPNNDPNLDERTILDSYYDKTMKDFFKHYKNISLLYLHAGFSIIFCTTYFLLLIDR